MVSGAGPKVIGLVHRSDMRQSLQLIRSGSKDLRNLIVNALSKSWPLTIPEIVESLKESTGSNVSYQGVSKSVRELLSQGVLVKEDNAYLLSLGWIDSLSHGLQELAQSYRSQANIWPEDLLPGESATYSFDTNIAEPHYWMLDMTLRLKPQHPDYFACVWHRAWFLTAITPKEFVKFMRLLHNHAMYVVCATKSDFDVFELKAWGAIGVKWKAGVSYSPSCELISIGEYVFSIYKPPKIMVEWAKKCNSKKSLKDKIVDLHNFVFKTQCNTKITITRDKELAVKIRKDIRRLF